MSFRACPGISIPLSQRRVGTRTPLLFEVLGSFAISLSQRRVGTRTPYKEVFLPFLLFLYATGEVAPGLTPSIQTRHLLIISLCHWRSGTRTSQDVTKNIAKRGFLYATGEVAPGQNYFKIKESKTVFISLCHWRSGTRTNAKNLFHTKSFYSFKPTVSWHSDNRY